jgi:hypothetical protein
MEPHIAKIMTYQNTSQQMWSKAERLYGKKIKLFPYLSNSTRTPAYQATTKSINF